MHIYTGCNDRINAAAPVGLLREMILKPFLTDYDRNEGALGGRDVGFSSWNKAAIIVSYVCRAHRDIRVTG